MLSLLNEGGTLGLCRDGGRQVGYVRQWWQEERGVGGMNDGGVGKRTVTV